MKEIKSINSIGLKYAISLTLCAFLMFSMLSVGFYNPTDSVD